MVSVVIGLLPVAIYCSSFPQTTVVCNIGGKGRDRGPMSRHVGALAVVKYLQRPS
jgi:hypothetical protein